MSVNGLQQPYVNNSLDGLVYVEVDGLTINGIPVDPTTFIPYTGATKPVSLGPFSLETLTSLSARQHNFTTFTSTMMTGPTTSSLFTADAWHLNNTIQISSLGGSFLSTSYLHIRDATNSSTLLTLQSDGIADFGHSIPRASTLATSNYDLVNLSTLSNAIAYLEGITSLNFVPYVGSLKALDMGSSTITTSGLTSVGALRITSSISNVDYSVSVNSTDFLEFTNLLTSQKVYTDGDSLWLPNRLFCNSTVYTHDIQMGSTIYFAYGTGQQWGTNLNGSGEYEIQDDVGDTRLKLSKSTGLTVSTLNVTAVPSATPTLALGINGSGALISFAVPSAGGSVNTSTTTARFLPYLSTANTLTNSLLNQIDNDSMGFGYTTIPNYPLGSGGKNMYINGSIFAGALNSMYATFGRDTNTSNPANEITFTASGAGVLLTQVKSHSGSSAFVDATWTYSNTNPTPLGANQGQVLLTANKMTMSADLTVNGDFRKQGGNSGANWFSLRGTDTLNSPYLEFFVANLRRSYIGYATTTSMNVFTENGANLQLGTEGLTRMSINPAGNISIVGDFTMNITKVIYLYYISATNHAGFYCEGSGDMLFFTGTGGVANRLRIASSGTATFSNALATNGNFTANTSIGNINGGNSYAVPSGFMSAGSLTLGDQTKNYGGGTTYWNSNTAGLMLECAVNTEIAVHDGGDRVASFMYYAGNTFTIGRDMGWGISAVNMPGIVTITGALSVGYSRYLYPPEASGATYGSLSMKGTGRNGWAGYSIYNDANQEVDFMCQNGANNYGLYNNVVARWNFYVDGGNQGDVAILNNANSRGFRTHNALTSNVIYNATPTTASNIGTWNGFGYTLLSNTQTPAGNAPCLGFGCNYSNTGQITCLQPGIAWMNLAIFNAQTTFTYFGVACGYTVPSGGANVSDVREKHCISDVCTKNSLRKIMCLKPKYYKRKYYDEGRDDQGNEKTKVPDDVKNAMCIGVMAQDLLESPLAPTVTVAPTKSDGACDGDDGTRYGVNYGDINIHLIGAVQELKKQNDAQQKKLDELEKIVSDQNKLLEFLLAKLK